MKTVKIIYHGVNCNDGYCSAIIVAEAMRHLGKVVDMRGLAPQDPVPWDWIQPGDEVFVVDISFKRSDMLRLKEVCPDTVCLDHHETAQANLAGLDFCKFDMQKSGAMLTWEWLHPGVEPPLLVKLVEDRDLWRYRYPETKPAHAGLTSVPKTVEGWTHLLHNDEALMEVVAAGQAILGYADSLVALIATKAYKTTLSGHQVVVVNSSLFQSELGDFLLKQEENKGCQFAMVWNRIQTKVLFSLRSRQGTEDNCASLAAQFSGGGHKHAAGFNLPPGRLGEIVAD